MILSRVKKQPSGCWEWQYFRNRWGYGRVSWQNKLWMAHRLFYTFLKGPIPKGMFVCHTCDNPPCCNPDHLWVGTAKDNNQDTSKKGRASGENRGYNKLTNEQVIEFLEARSKATKKSWGMKAMAQRFGVNNTALHKIAKGKNWKHLKREWDEKNSK